MNPQGDYFWQHRCFRDFDEYTEMARAWDLHFHQLDGGSFEGELFQIATESAQLGRARFNRALHQQGSTPHDLRTFVVSVDPAHQIFWRGQHVHGDQLLVFPKSGELAAMSRAGFDVYTFSVSEELLVDAARRRGLPTHDQLIDGIEVLDCQSKALHALRGKLEDLYRGAAGSKARTEGFNVLESLQVELPSALLDALASARQAQPLPPSALRRKGLERALEFLAAFPLAQHTVQDLCREADVSERTLEYAFHACFGVGPKSYLQSCRLNGLRAELRDADPAVTKVRTLASRWGFHHTGQLATDYRKHFGELPSQTLRRPSR